MAKNMKGLFPKDLLKDHSGDSDDEEDEDVKRMKQAISKTKNNSDNLKKETKSDKKKIESATKEAILKEKPILCAEDNSISIEKESLNLTKKNFEDYREEASKQAIFSKNKNKNMETFGEKIEEEDEEISKVSEIKENKLFEGLAYLYHQQLNLAENQNRLEKKIDNILEILNDMKKKKM